MSKKKEEISAEKMREVMSDLGKKKTPAKTAASRRNIAIATEARRKDPMDSICICAGGDSLKASDHKTTCPRGRLLWQRERAAAKKAAQ